MQSHAREIALLAQALATVGVLFPNEASERLVRWLISGQVDEMLSQTLLPCVAILSYTSKRIAYPPSDEPGESGVSLRSRNTLITVRYVFTSQKVFVET